MMTPKQILVKARSLINKGWTKGPFAADKKGKEVPTNSKKACKWCAVGALFAATETNLYGTKKKFPDAGRTAEELVLQAAAKCGYVPDPDSSSVVLFNEEEGRTKKQVLRVFDKAIKMADKS